MRLAPSVIVLALLSAPACGSKTGAPDTTTPTVATPDTTVAAEPDTTVVAEPDTAVVAEPDTTVAAEPDTTVAAEPDTAVAAEPEPEPTPDTRAKPGPDATCMPSWYAPPAPAPDGSYQEPGEPTPQLRLGRVADQIVLCALDRNYELLAGVLACWNVDATTGALSARAAAPLPGQSYVARVQKGCAASYCPPAGVAFGETALIATSTDGERVVVLGQSERDFHIFDAASKKHLRALPNGVDDEPEPKGVGNEPIEVAYIGRRFYVVGTDAGPFVGVWAFGDGGERYGPLVDRPASGPDDYPTMTSVWGGNVNVLDDSRLGVSVTGLDHLDVVAGDGTRTSIKRKTPKNPCNEEDMRLFGEGIDEKPRCMKHLAKVFAPWADARLVALPSGGYLAVQDSGALVVLDDKLAETRRFAAPFCNP